jgi:hypothetical protein
MHGVRFRQVQERGWTFRLQQLSGEVYVACAEYSFFRLHLQRWLFWGGWRDMHGVRFRQVQERGWTYRLQQLPGWLELACAEYSFDRLHLQCWLFWG